MTQQPEVMIGHAMGRFDQEGNLTDVVTKEFIIGLLQNLAEWTRRIARDDLPLYIFSSSDDPVGQKLAGVVCSSTAIVARGLRQSLTIFIQAAGTKCFTN